MPLVDAHVHCFPDRLAVAVRDRLNQRGGLKGSPLLTDVANAVQSDGFDRAWILPYAHRAGVAESVNEWSATEVSRYPWLIAGATFHPSDANLARLVHRALVELGLRVVKLHCSVGQFSPADPRLDPLWAVAERLGVPVVTHAGQVGPGETTAAELEDLVTVLTRFPRLPLVLAHSGFPALDRAMELMAQHGGLFCDLTPVWDQPIAPDPAALSRFADRILFGSDAPNNPTSAGGQRARLRSLGLPTERLELILGGTADRLVTARKG